MMNHSQARFSDRSLIGLWLRRPENISRYWLNKYTVCAAWLGLLLAILSPPQGNGILACWLKAGTGLPCPGCGLTRSLSCGLRGMFLESWRYHPMGLVILGFFLATAAASLLPPKRRQSLANFMRSKAILSNALFLAFVVAFVGFGLVRGVVVFTHIG